MLTFALFPVEMLSTTAFEPVFVFAAITPVLAWVVPARVKHCKQGATAAKVRITTGKLCENATNKIGDPYTVDKTHQNDNNNNQHYNW